MFIYLSDIPLYILLLRKTETHEYSSHASRNFKLSRKYIVQQSIQVHISLYESRGMNMLKLLKICFTYKKSFDNNSLLLSKSVVPAVRVPVSHFRGKG